MIDVELALAKQKISTLETHLTATEQRAERAEADLAAARALLTECKPWLHKTWCDPLMQRIDAALAGKDAP
jgi:hypothetical protein